MTSTFSSLFKFEIPDFNTKPWHSTLNATIRRIDTVIYNALVSNSATVWAIATEYEAGNIGVDTTDGTIWLCRVNHTSAGSGAFSDDRTANPTYWIQFTAVLNPRGAWANDATYSFYDIVYDVTTSVIALCHTAHTSNASPGVLADDLATYWDVIADFAPPNDAANIEYDNADSGLVATDVKAAIDEVDTAVETEASARAAADALLAPKASPTFTGTPLSTTASWAVNTTQIATTAHVYAATRRAAQTLSDGATPALDASLGKVFALTAAGNRQIAVPTNPKFDGDVIIIRHTASGASRTLSLNTGAGGFRYTTDVTALSATAQDKTDYIGCMWHATDSKWDVISYIKGA